MPARVSGVGTGASAAWCGCTPMVHHRFGCSSVIGGRRSDWASVVPMVTISVTPAAVARASTSGSSIGREVVEVAVAIHEHQAAGST